jgi:hypothetical protein
MRNTAVAAAVLAVLGLGATACQSAVSGQGESGGPSSAPAAPHGGNGGNGENGADISPSPSAGPPTRTVSSGTTVSVGPVHLVVPRGWTYDPDTTDNASPHAGCLSDARNPCFAVLLDMGPLMNQPDVNVNLPDPKAEFGWYPGTDVPQCPALGTEAPSDATDGHPISSGNAPVGPHTAVYATFQVRCQQEAQDGVIRMWWLPTSKVWIDEYHADGDRDQQFDAMLRTATFDS